jgi:uncharacterized protein
MISIKKILLCAGISLLTITSFAQTRQDSRSRTKAAIPKTQIRDSIINGINSILDSFTGQPNTDVTWKKVKNKIEDFLYPVWIKGRLTGEKTEHAFFVHTGLQVMTQTDIRQRKLVVVTGLAFIRPAEFDVIRFEKQL